MTDPSNPLRSDTDSPEIVVEVHPGPTGPQDAPGAGGPGTPQSPWVLFRRRFLRDKIAIASGIFILLLVAFALLAPVFENWTGHRKGASNPSGADDFTLLPVGPFHNCDGLSRIGEQDCFVLGASNVRGLDMLVELSYGARTSLLIGLVATFLAVIVALVVGIIAGYYGGAVDQVLARFMDLIAAFPFLLFAIAMSVVIGSTRLTVISIIVLFSWFYPARLFRGEVLSLREREFIAAAKMLGAPTHRILFRHILPHLIPISIVYGTLAIANAITFEAALSFLGFGLPVEVPSWGRMIADAIPGGLYRNAPHLMLFPGSLLVLTVLAFNLLGDGLRDALDPRASIES